jgi:hypothetical protein
MPQSVRMLKNLSKPAKNAAKPTPILRAHHEELSLLSNGIVVFISANELDFQTYGVSSSSFVAKRAK